MTKPKSIMYNSMRLTGVLLLLVVLTGCSDSDYVPPLEDIDVIIARHTRPDSIVIERPESGGLFRARVTSIVGNVGMAHGGTFRTEEGKTLSFQYPAVEGMYYVATSLTDESGELSLLVILYSDTLSKSNIDIHGEFSSRE